MGKILESLKTKKALVSDGAWGTFLQLKGLAAGDCPELWNLERRSDVLDIAKSYIEAGSDMIETNSFGGSAIKLSHYGLKEKTYEINKAAAEISREAAGDKIVLGSVGPTGKFLMMGDVTKDDLKEAFRIQIEGLRDGGADAICIETFYDIDEAKIAVEIAKNFSDLEVICTFSFENKTDDGYKSMMGLGVKEAISSVIESGADIVGTNCGNGFKAMVDIVSEIKPVAGKHPILVHANAGLPELVGTELVYPETPVKVKTIVPLLLDAGVSLIGGCCGTTPAHIKAIKKTVFAYF